MQRFGEKLRTLRTGRGLTMRELAQELGYTSHAHIGFFESGQRKPSLEFAMRAAGYFSVSVDQLLRDDLELPPSPPAPDG